MPRLVNRDLSKLPAWARQRIETLENNVRYLERQVQSASSPQTTNTCINDYAAHPGPTLRGLPPHSRIRYGTEHDWIEVRLLDRNAKMDGVQWPEGECVLELHCGTGRLSLHPGVSNSVYVKAEER